MTNRTHKWETEFWHYVSTGDGVNCPVYQYCPIRFAGERCSCPLYEIVPGGQPQGETFCHPIYNAGYCLACRGSECLCIGSNAGFLEKLKPGRIFELLQILSESWLKVGEVKSPPVPIELIKLMDKSCPIEVRTVPMKAYSGAIWKMNDGWVIYLNSNECVATQRLTAFHEAFHILAHCRATPVFKKRGSDRGIFNELLADNFALHTLMPRKWVEKQWAKHRDPAVLAKQFQLTEETVRQRLKSLGLLTYGLITIIPCMAMGANVSLF